MSIGEQLLLSNMYILYSYKVKTTIIKEGGGGREGGLEGGDGGELGARAFHRKELIPFLHV